jgi:hypothetical protein
MQIYPLFQDKRPANLANVVYRLVELNDLKVQSQLLRQDKAQVQEIID